MVTLFIRFNKLKNIMKPIAYILVSIAIWTVLLTRYSWIQMIHAITVSEHWLTKWVHWPTWLEIFIFYFLFIFLFRFWWVNFWSNFEDLSNTIYIILTKKLAHLGLLKELIWLIKFYHSFLKRILKLFQTNLYFIRWYKSDSETYNYLAQSTLNIIFFNIKILMFNFFTLLALVITVCVNLNISLPLIWQETLNLIVNFKFDIIWNEAISKVPVLLAVLSIIFIFLYLNGTKGFIRRAVASANRKKLEEVLNEHREIVYEIGSSLNTAFDNLDYVMLNRSNLAKAWIQKTYEENKILEPLLKEYYPKSVYDYNQYIEMLKEVESLESLYSKIQNKRTFYDGVMGYFLRLSPRLQGYQLLLPYRNQAKKLETYFFTPKGLDIIYQIKPISQLHFKVLAIREQNELLEALHEDEEFMYELILEKIVNALEAQFALIQYVDSASKYLHLSSDFMGRNIRSLFNKDSW
ncbi:hypothetical protein [Brevibacillus parabrevis]|uniref:hypothetical protein n=1 Tax=Brevibacillus parabrevis TaxID=54914 RepID=UPI002E1EFF1E|nr:hypothetical protein [Brevibacillus parabrevis]